VIPPRAGEVIGDSAERRVEILSDADELNATWSRFGPRREGADLHVHRLHSDLFYVLSGELTLRLGPVGTEVRAPAGALAHVPPLVVHGFRNGSDAEVVYLNFHAPGRRFADYLRSVRDRTSFSYDQHDPPADGGRSPADASVGAAVAVDANVTLLVDVDEIAVAEVGADGCAPHGRERHVHPRHVESLYVLDGPLTIAAEGRKVEAAAGTWVQVPPGTPHAVTAAASGTRFLELHTPGSGFGAFLRAGGDDAAAAGFDYALP
jgi:quercetin dioxygenase-like cupin family protein